MQIKINHNKIIIKKCDFFIKFITVLKKVSSFIASF